MEGDGYMTLEGECFVYIKSNRLVNIAKASNGNTSQHMVEAIERAFNPVYCLFQRKKLTKNAYELFCLPHA